MKQILLAGAVATLVAGPGTAAPVADYSSLVVVGTSISDAGNVHDLTTNVFPFLPDFPLISNAEPGDERYYQGRFSNGPVWADIVGQEFTDAGRPVINEAYGASRTYTDVSTPLDLLIPDLPEQILLAAGQAGQIGLRPLVVVESGSNDLFAWTEQRSAVTPSQAAANVVDRLGDIIGLGVRDIVVFNSVDLGVIPRYARYLPQLAPLASQAAGEFNAALETGLAALQAPDVRLDLLDVHGLFSDLFARPGAYGITELAAPCVEVNLSTNPPVFTPGEGDAMPSVCDDAAGRAFFDANHPASQVHAALASAFLETIDPQPQVIPVPASLPLLAAGLVALGLVRRRRS